MSQEEFKAPDWVNQTPIGEPTEGPTKKQRFWLRFTLLVVIPFCLWAGWFEFGRAQEGNWRAWVYTFEWPFFGVLAFYLYKKLMRGESIKIKIPTPNLENLENKNKNDGAPGRD